MARLSTLFAGTAVLFLILGLLTTRFDLRVGLSITWSGTGYLVPNRVLCYGVAACFGLFAFLYSLWIVPWSYQAGMWHFMLSVLLAASFLVASIAMQRADGLGDHSARVTSLSVFLFSPTLFLCLQSAYLLDSLRRCCQVFLRS